MMGNNSSKRPLHESGSSTTCLMGNINAEITLRVFLIGKTGHGKSATGNSILGRKVFQTSSQSKSKTKAVEDAWAQYGRYEIQVVDGPGLEDTDLNAAQNKEQACKNMATALMKCNGGVHAFLLVIKFGTRFTREERQTISDLKQIFGDDYLKNHGIIVFSGGEAFPGQVKADGTPRKTFKQWCQEQDEDCYNLIQECGSRVVLFNNILESEEEKIKQRNELFLHAETIQKKGGLYTSDHFQVYAQAKAKLIKDSKLKLLEETVQKRIYLLSAKLLQLSIDSSLKDVDLLDARIENVYAEIGSESQQEESMKQLLVSLERLRRATKELRRAIEEKNMENIQEQLAALSEEREKLNQESEFAWGSIFEILWGIFPISALLVSMGKTLLTLVADVFKN